MKKSLLLLFIIPLLFVGCKKDDQPTGGNSTSVDTSYAVSFFYSEFGNTRQFQKGETIVYAADSAVIGSVQGITTLHLVSMTVKPLSGTTFTGRVSKAVGTVR